MRALGYFTFRDLIHDGGRSLLTILSLGVVAASYLLISALSRAYLVFGKQTQVSTNLVIIEANTIDPMESTLNETVLQEARQTMPDQIQNTFPMIFRHLAIERQIMQLRAAPLEEMRSGLSLTLSQGQWPEDGPQIMISEGVTHVTPWKIGSTVNIYGTNFQVVGVVRAGGNQFATIWMTYIEGQRLFGPLHGFQIGYLQLNPSADPESVRARLQSDPRFSGRYEVYLEDALSSQYTQTNHNLLTLSLIQAIISLLAVTFGTYNATSMSLTERRSEIALLRTLGFTQEKVRTFLFTRSLVLTLVAYLIGWAVSFIIIIYQRSHATMNIFSVPLTLSLTPSVLLVGLLLSATFSFLGVWLTTERSARLGPLAERD